MGTRVKLNGLFNKKIRGIGMWDYNFKTGKELFWGRGKNCKRGKLKETLKIRKGSPNQKGKGDLEAQRAIRRPLSWKSFPRGEIGVRAKISTDIVP